MTCGGGALVIKRPTDPARFNSATGTVCVTGAAASGLILEGDKVSFEQSGADSQTIDCGENGSQFVFYGVTPSETMNDASITLKTIGGETLISTNLTVLWVDISMRCGQGDSLSPDNGMNQQIAGHLRLGTQIIDPFSFQSTGEIFNILLTFGNVVEFRGQVHPHDFVDAISLLRDNGAEYSGFIDSGEHETIIKYTPNITRKPEPDANDIGPEEFHDDNPAPDGFVYDVDTPGLSPGEGVQLPNGRIYYTRCNFLEYAVFENVRCSNDFAWFNRTEIETITTNSISDFRFSDQLNQHDGNLCGSGHCTLSLE